MKNFEEHHVADLIKNVFHDRTIFLQLHHALALIKQCTDTLNVFKVNCGWLLISQILGILKLFDMSGCLGKQLKQITTWYLKLWISRTVFWPPWESEISTVNCIETKYRHRHRAKLSEVMLVFLLFTYISLLEFWFS